MTPSVPPAMQQLRERTNREHKALEAQAFHQSWLKHQLPLSHYVRLLTFYHSIWEKLEKQLSGSYASMVKDVWSLDMAKTPLLQHDLSFFRAQSNLPTDEVAIEWSSGHKHLESEPAALLGALYVLEGSTLGGQILRKHLQHMYGLQDDGLRYYTGYGKQTGSRWKAFKSRMDQALASSETIDVAVEAARHTFTRIGDGMAAIQSLATP
ncbi:MAG: biliverdin-producing heme oxygenase [Deltaproteobacteria bacterium]|nr:MAG: biliverdin-producing heme oxygenase [Deltaproteobacteria bacterium]